jgi:hypothetical protein
MSVVAGMMTREDSPVFGASGKRYRRSGVEEVRAAEPIVQVFELAAPIWREGPFETGAGTQPRLPSIT